MANATNEYYQQGEPIGPLKRFVSTHQLPKTFAAGTGIILAGTALTYNTSTGFWQVFRGQVNEVNTITANATPATDGTFTLSFNLQTTGAIAHDADAATVQAALEALSTVGEGNVEVVMTNGDDLGDSSAVMQITWVGDLAGQNVTLTANFGGLTGNTHVLATATAGGADEANGTNLLKGFAWPNDITLDATGEVQGVVMLSGEVHRDDIPLVAGAYDQVELDAALRTQARGLNITVQGLTQVR